MEINGIAHTMLTVSDYDACKAFYAKLLPFLGLRPVFDADGFLYCVGGRTAFGIQKGDAAHERERFVQARVGLHHVCFRARERADVEELHRFLSSWARRSCTRRRTVRGGRATTRCCSKTRTGSGSR